MPSPGAFELGDQPCQDFTPRETYWGHNEHECYAIRLKREGNPNAECGSTVSFCENCNYDHHAFGYERCGTPAAEGWVQYRAALAEEMPHLAPREGDSIERVRERTEIMQRVSTNRARGVYEAVEHHMSELDLGPED